MVGPIGAKSIGSPVNRSNPAGLEMDLFDVHNAGIAGHIFRSAIVRQPVEGADKPLKRNPDIKTMSMKPENISAPVHKYDDASAIDYYRIYG